MTSIVYFMRCENGVGPIKIGCTKAPEERLHALAAWSPFPLAVLASMPGSFDLESRFHARHAGSHSHREWFEETPLLLSDIDAVRRGVFDVECLPGRMKKSLGVRRYPEAEYEKRALARKVESRRWKCFPPVIPVPQRLLDQLDGFVASSPGEQDDCRRAVAEFLSATKTISSAREYLASLSKGDVQC